MKKLFITLSIALAASASMFAGEPVKVAIHENDASGEIISPEIYGQFSEHLGSCIYGGIWVGKDSPIPNIEGYRLDVFNALKDLKVPVLRWPGGCFADDYHWMDGIGPQEQRTNICNNNWGGTIEDNSFGTHEFLNFCELLGTEPYISGNVGSGTVKEMADWIEYMTSDSQSDMANLRRKNGRDKPWHVKYFGVGNECWGCGGQMRADYYVDVYRRYANYLRNYYPNFIYKIASGASDYDYNWTETLMKGAGTQMHGISLHYYSVRNWDDKGSATNFTPVEYYQILSKAIGIEEVVRKHVAIMDEIDPEGKVDLLVDEWGTWFNVEPGTNPGHLFQQSTMRDAMVAALTLNIFHKYARRVKMTNIAQVVNVLQAMILTRDDQMVLTPTYHVFKMYNVHQGAEVIPVDYTTDIIGVDGKRKAGMASFNDDTTPALSVTASRKDGVINIDLVNTDLENAQEILLTWDNMNNTVQKGSRTKTVKPTVSVEGQILSALNIDDYNHFGEPAVVAPAPYDEFKVTKEGIEITIPKHSIIALSIK